jgi:GMP synthase-like glutamine amidotransferase
MSRPALGSQPLELLVVQHVEREGPGLLAEVAKAAGLKVRRLRPFAGDPLPGRISPHQLLAVMGGPMGVADIGDPAFPWLEPLVGLLQQALAEGLPVIGFCLGAQLLALAAGGGAGPLEVGDPPLPHREVGFGSINFISTETAEPVLTGLPASLLVLHWHGDRIELPASATLLASSLSCPEQLFRIGPAAYGLQCHIEVGPEALEQWIREDASFVASALGGDGAARIRADGNRWLQATKPLWWRLLTNILNECLLTTAQQDQ